MAISTRRGKIWDDRLQGMATRSRQNMEQGAITETYRANKDDVIQLLNRALASEWVAFMQYWHHYFMATDIHSIEIREYFKESSAQELHHIEEIGNRIQALGGVPSTKPEEVIDLWPGTVEYGHDLRSMLEHDLAAERMTVSFYTEIVRHCGFDDVVTRHIFEEILSEEEEHANNITDLLFAVDSSTGKRMAGLHEQIEEKIAAAGAVRAPRAA